MTRIDFYTLEPDTGGDRFLLTCRLVKTIRDSDLRILIHCPDREQACHLDRLLWTFRQDSFLPHGLVGNVDPELTPILIGSDGTPENESQALINLSLAIPAFLDRFARVVEPLDHDSSVRAAGRERYRDYRERGYPLEHHWIRL